MRLLKVPLLLALACGANTARADSDAEFVRVRGTEFALGARAFRFLGANVSVIHGPRERAGYEAVLDAAVADGLRVVRVWALGEQLAPGAAHHPLYAFRIGEAGWVEDSFVQLDRVLAGARERQLKVIVVLANRWQDYGGIATYLSWASSAEASPGPAAESARPAEASPGSAAGYSVQAAFFECVRCQTLYREHVERILSRVNSVNGVAYRDDPTIMAWELINEASAVSAHEEEALLAWVVHTARAIRARDPQHLIGAGHVGFQTSRESHVWQRIQALPEIDYADAHLYPQSDARVRTHAEPYRVLSQLLDDLVRRAHEQLHKPLLIGEFGFKRAARTALPLRWLDAFTRVARERAVDGALIWQYEPPGSPLRAYTILPDASDALSAAERHRLQEAAHRLAASLTGSGVQGAPVGPVMSAQSTPGTAQVQRRVRRVDGVRVMDIAAEAFARARFERFGVYRGHALLTVWGQGEGTIDYRFALSGAVPRALKVEARISSELPGAGDGGDPRDGSDIEISLDERVLGTVRAKADDGLGELVSIEVVDPLLLRRLFMHSANHRLRFRALPSPYAGGLCIYGAATKEPPLLPAQVRALDTVRLTFSDD